MQASGRYMPLPPGVPPSQNWQSVQHAPQGDTSAIAPGMAPEGPTGMQPNMIHDRRFPAPQSSHRMSQGASGRASIPDMPGFPGIHPGMAPDGSQNGLQPGYPKMTPGVPTGVPGGRQNFPTYPDQRNDPRSGYNGMPKLGVPSNAAYPAASQEHLGQGHSAAVQAMPSAPAGVRVGSQPLNQQRGSIIPQVTFGGGAQPHMTFAQAYSRAQVLAAAASQSQAHVQSPTVAQRIASANAAVSAAQSIAPPLQQPVPDNRPYMAKVGMSYLPGGDVVDEIKCTSESMAEVVDEVTAQRTASQFSSYLQQKRLERADKWRIYWRWRPEINEKILAAEVDAIMDAQVQAAEDEISDDESPDMARRHGPVRPPLIYANPGAFDLELPSVLIPDPEMVAAVQAQAHAAAQAQAQALAQAQAHAQTQAQAQAQSHAMAAAQARMAHMAKFSSR